MYYPYFDPTFLFLIPGLILAMYAQLKVQSTFARFSQVPASGRVNGAQVARAVLDSQGLHDVDVEMIQGRLSDHYDPRVKKVRLSPEVYQGYSLASLGVAAHETGHAVQHAERYLPLSIREGLVPVVNFSSSLAFPLFILGIILASTGLVKIGIILFSAVVLFQLVTLPVELNASRRALAVLQSHGFITSSEIDGTRSVLNAAALTYVASALVGILNLFRLLILSGAFRGRDD